MPETPPETGVDLASSGSFLNEPVGGNSYSVERLLGEGGMGRVYQAYDNAGRRVVALKVVRPPRQRAPGVEASVDVRASTAFDVGGSTVAALPTSLEKRRLFGEAQSMATLVHPNVVQIYDVGVSTADEVFIAMELLVGPTLEGWANAAPRTWREILTVYLQAGKGLAAAHASGIIHRDFKPSNVLFGDDGRVRVIDFGLARAQPVGEGPLALASPVTRLTQAGHILGTLLYMAPEQALGERLDARADQFAFCVALYEALFRQLPFTGETVIGRVKDIQRDQVTPPPGHDVPPRLVQAVLRGLRADPKDRWGSMNELLAALEQAGQRRIFFVAAVVLAVASLVLAAVYMI